MTQENEAGKQAVSGITIFGEETNAAFTSDVDRMSGQRTVQCYQCGECTAGCPAAFAMDISPNRVMRMVQLGCEKPVLQSSTIWLCAGCETCATRCPKGLSVSKVMDACRQMAVEKKSKTREKDVLTFHKQFLAEVKRHGRIHEMGMLARYKVLSGQLFNDMPLGMKMFMKGKLAIAPTKIKGVDEIKKIFRKM